MWMVFGLGKQSSAYQQIFSEIPGKYWDKYHWYNIPVSADIGSHTNALTLIKRVATPKDFVVFKLDVDAPQIEHAMMQQILEDEELFGLIDVMFYEHHITTKEFAESVFKYTFPDTLSDLFNLFIQLRKKGMLIHSWI
eukprot:Phypoly_transcript_12997.p1 GENE.Phypoly_transcript_12997~~Phypoly_transcript_12997.p1  ORF type:complete len:138 (+),score=18.37 Phypoly_transcript_12997:647-1060(+)